jgi:hypothetical protein
MNFREFKKVKSPPPNPEIEDFKICEFCYKEFAFDGQNRIKPCEKHFNWMAKQVKMILNKRGITLYHQLEEYFENHENMIVIDMNKLSKNYGVIDVVPIEEYLLYDKPTIDRTYTLGLLKALYKVEDDEIKRCALWKPVIISSAITMTSMAIYYMGGYFLF